jgi:hypothetical protein
MDDKEIWKNLLKNKELESKFTVEAGIATPISKTKKVFKTEEEKEILKKMKQLEKRMDDLEKQNDTLVKDNVLIKRKLKTLNDRNMNEVTNSKE